MIIVSKRLKLQYLKCLAWRGTSPSFYMCVIECVVALKYIESKIKVGSRSETILMLAITEFIADM